VRLELKVSVIQYTEAILRATLRDYPNTDRHLEYAQTFLKMPPNPTAGMIRLDIGYNWIQERAAA
jgi:hypothetical protein